jgi:hypothetical protein
MARAYLLVPSTSHHASSLGPIPVPAGVPVPGPLLSRSTSEGRPRILVDGHAPARAVAMSRAGGGDQRHFSMAWGTSAGKAGVSRTKRD